MNDKDASGSLNVAVGHSFDTIKTRLQCAPPGTYKGALDCLRQTIRNESIFALYKGATPPPWSLRSGFQLTFGSSVSAFVATPMELLKGTYPTDTFRPILTTDYTATVNLQLQRQRAVSDRKFKGPIDCARQVIKANGVTGLWRGLGGSLAFRRTPYEMSTGTANFISGGLASFLFWFTAIPSDNVKNRIMSSDFNVKGLSPISVAKDIYRTTGFRGFYAGLTPTVLRAFPVNASALFVYEGILRLLGAEKVQSPQDFSAITLTQLLESYMHTMKAI
ncbi:hypothetical protein Clacol_008476 [Clathrus columnatus]|uniref:Uncharacterized protein n=1 Tax=Clathrus columnatus TaxID=1419009 RepID=A0AAV5ANG0_9AGAM|nr:hypothetical protein Clacol_008476 [Clathrus columnatus]